MCARSQLPPELGGKTKKEAGASNFYLHVVTNISLDG